MASTQPIWTPCGSNCRPARWTAPPPRTLVPAVQRPVGHASMPAKGRGDADDVALPAARDHLGQHQPAAGEHTVSSPRLRCAPPARSGPGRADRHHPRVVDRGTSMWPPPSGAPCPGRSRTIPGSVTSVGGPKPAPERAQLRDGGLFERHVAVTDHHPRPTLQQCPGGGEADTARAAPVIATVLPRMGPWPRTVQVSTFAGKGFASTMTGWRRLLHPPSIRTMSWPSR